MARSSTVFSPLLTERLLVRPCRASDVDALVARRNDAAVAALQSWTLPYPREDATATVTAAAAAGGPTSDAWWMATVADAGDREVLGDVAVHLTAEGRSAEIGYTFAREHWGHGYATEAVSAVLDWLWDAFPLTRVQAGMHPDNLASARVLERVGFVFEAYTRLSCWIDDDNSDDLIYAMLRDDREAWRRRPRTRPATVRLVEIDASTSHRVRELRTHRTEERFVSPVLESFADALFPEVVDGHPAVPWMRAVEADGTIAGFVMLALSNAQQPTPCLWRLLVDRLHQRRGIGTAVLDLVVEACRSMGDDALLTSWSEGRGSPRPFYETYGFVPTGDVVDDETEARLTL